MDTLVHLGLLNAALATLLALLAAAARGLCRRPALIHALWLLVLLKLLTPPFLAVPIAWLPHPEPTAAPPAPTMLPSAGPLDEDVPLVLLGPPVIDDRPQPSLLRADPDAAAPPQGQVAASPAKAVVEPTGVVSDEASPSTELASAGPSWEQVVAALWLTGSLLWWTLAGVRLYRFRKSLHTARPAPAALQQRATRLAERLGLFHGPRVYVLPAPIMPLLWAVAGEPCLLLPAVLWARLTPEQQETLLAHELAHLRRGDPWVRRLEIVVLGLYWWHPVVWWARHEIQEAEEQCCDAWVLWALPAAAEAYAAALLETVAFLSRLRPALPLGASGAGHTHLLRRRLTMILQGTAPRALSWTTLAALLVCGAALLPLRPAWGQDKSATPPVDNQPAATTPAPATAAVAQQATPVPAPKLSGTSSNSDINLTSSIGLSPDVEQAQDAVELLQVQLEGKKAELLEAQALVEQTRRQLNRQNRLREKGLVSEEDVEQLRSELAVREARLQAKEAQFKEAEVRLRQANRWLSRLQTGAPPPSSTGTASPFGSQPTPYPKPASSVPSTGSANSTPPPRLGSTSGPVGNTPGTTKVPAGSGGTLPKTIEHSPTQAGGEQRMRDLEMKLDKLLKEVDALRREIRRQRPSGDDEAAVPADPNVKPSVSQGR